MGFGHSDPVCPSIRNADRQHRALRSRARVLLGQILNIPEERIFQAAPLLMRCSRSDLPHLLRSTVHPAAGDSNHTSHCKWY